MKAVMPKKQTNKQKKRKKRMEKKGNTKMYIIINIQ
jgi:hypothetical protein